MWKEDRAAERRGPPARWVTLPRRVRARRRHRSTQSPTAPRQPRRPMPSSLRRSAFPALALLLSACATTGATFGSGVGDRLLERPPYYAGAALPAGRLAHLPVAYQPGAAQPAFLDPSAAADAPVARLLAELTAQLDSLVAGPRLASLAGTPPDVLFGCATDALGDCAGPEDAEAMGRGGDALRLAVGNPSPEWRAALGPALAAAGVEGLLVVTLEVGQYRPRQRGLRGSKVVALGTGHEASLPWLTSLETPVSVLQLTAVHVGADGRARRIGAEGFMAVRTPLLASAVGAQRLVSDEDVARARTMRRDDLPGAPLAWQVALRHLVAGVTGGSPD